MVGLIKKLNPIHIQHMSKNEQTSSRVATLASKALRGGHLTPKEVKSLAGGLLTQAPDKKKKSR